MKREKPLRKVRYWAAEVCNRHQCSRCQAGAAVRVRAQQADEEAVYCWRCLDRWADEERRRGVEVTLVFPPVWVPGVGSVA